MAEFIMLMAIVVFMCLFMWGCSPSPEPPTASASRKVSATQMAGMDKDKIRELLRHLDIRETPEVTFGAMCYAMAGPPEQVDYVCPVCGEKTIYKEGFTWLIQYDLPNMRNDIKLIRKISKMDISLDELSFCQRCRPADAMEPALVLKIAYDDGQIHTVPGVSWEDIVCLRDFFRKKLTFTTSNEGEEPLKERLNRLEELLGVKVEP